MKNRPLGHNPWFAPVQTRDQTPNPEHDDDDQRALRAFGRKLDEIMFEAGIGGVLLLTSKKSMSWMMSFPRWSGLTNEGVNLRLRTKMSTPEGRENANATLGFIGDVRDLSFEIHGFFASFFKQIDRKLKDKGGSIEHPRIGTPGHMGPRSEAKAKAAQTGDDATKFNADTCTSAGRLREWGVELDPSIPDAAWVQDSSIIRRSEDGASEIQIQIWEPFRWIEPSLHDSDDKDPPLLTVRRPPAVPDDSTSTS